MNVLQMVRVVVGKPPRKRFVPHFGYNSLFPLALQLLHPDAPEFSTYLDKLLQPELLWTPYGLRSLAATSSMYLKHNTAHDSPYWRGAIWVNINFLVLRSLNSCGRCASARSECDSSHEYQK
jgi:mannosyl-oligosaccharide glucosidase